MRLGFIAAALIVVASACGGSETAPPTSPATSSTTAAMDGSASVATTSPNVGATDTLAIAPAVPTTEAADFAVFLAAVDLALADTSYADVVLEDADLFVAVGQLMCERLDEGAPADDVLGEFLSELENDGVAGNDEVVAVGVTFGGAIESICPRHREVLE